jgi:hypothetical protein
MTALGVWLLAGCGALDAPSTEAPVTEAPATVDTSVPSPSSPTSMNPGPDTPSTVDAPAPPPDTDAPSVRAFLAPLVIDDRPQPQRRYDRGEWPHWADTDGDGCDARQQALAAASITPPQIDPYRCKVLAGDWLSAYDGVSTEDPGDLDVDHLVPLADAHTTGGWRWTPALRREFANDQRNLWVVSASSNRSKGSDTPDQWRPARREVWCEFAIRWVQIKVTYALSATTSERDALGTMLDTCSVLPPVPARP